MEKKYIMLIIFSFTIYIVFIVILFSNIKIGKIKNENINILDIKTYYAKSKITVNSNKTTNTYILEEWVKGEKEKNISTDEKGKKVKIILNKNNIILKTDLQKLEYEIEKSKNINRNEYILMDFIKTFNEEKNINKSYMTENEIVFEIEMKEKQKVMKKILTVNKNTFKPISIKNLDNNKNVTSYIEYIEFNNKKIEDSIFR